jgi:hypothetical protein
MRAHSVIELPSGTIRETQTQPGATLEFPAASQAGDSFARKHIFRSCDFAASATPPGNYFADLRLLVVA